MVSNKLTQDTQSTQGTDKILINEYFTSIQGEGFYSGVPAFFIRFSGCDIGCKWCDTRDAISMKNSKLTDITEILQRVIENRLELVVVTGGEPALHPLKFLFHELKKARKTIHLETSGAYPLDALPDWMTLSPKSIFPPLKENYPMADELKIVISEPKDFDFAMEQAGYADKNCRLFLQPEWAKKDQVMPAIINFIKENPRWRLSLQIHKYLGLK